MTNALCLTHLNQTKGTVSQTNLCKPGSLVWMQNPSSRCRWVQSIYVYQAVWESITRVSEGNTLKITNPGAPAPLQNQSFLVSVINHPNGYSCWLKDRQIQQFQDQQY